MPRPRTKIQLASDHVEEAISQCSKALSRLGGRVRRRPGELPSSSLYEARSYLESVINRLGVTKFLIDTNQVAYPPTLKDDFELTYDRDRNPGC